MRVTGWWQRLSRPWRLTLMFMGLLLLAYGALCLATLDGSVNIAVDYRQRMQDAQPVGPEDERSWPLIRYAQSIEGEGRLRILREAAGRARIGFKFHPARAKADLFPFIVVPPTPGLLDDSVLNLQLPHLPLYGGASKDFAADMTAAAAAGDGGRAVDDAQAIIGLARQLATPGATFIQQLVAWASFDLAATAIAREVTAHPAAFTDEDLSRLSVLLGSIDPAVFRLDLSVERFMMHDLLQRLYTDDGKGDGSLTLEASVAMRSGAFGRNSVGGQLPRWLAALASPAHSMVAAPRSELARRWTEYMDSVQAEADRQPWLRDADEIAVFQTEINYSSWHSKLRNELFLTLAPPDGAGLNRGTDAQTMADAARVVVAAEQCRRATGRWPQSLEELAQRLNGKLPVDPWTGTPLRVGVVDGALRVWSLGPDRTDEGGFPAADSYPTALPPLVGPHSRGWFTKGTPVSDPAPAPQLIKGWMAIPNHGATWPNRGDWVLWPHDPPVISPGSGGSN